MAHGGGGRLMQQLLDRVFFESFDNPWLAQRHDSAALQIPTPKIAFTTDSYVVQPLFFPGGDIGSLAVNGTVNDLAMSGARPLYLSAGFILEEGLELEILERVVRSMRQAADKAQVQIVTGDTKVIEKQSNRDRASNLFINTAGIGIITHHQTIAPQSVRPGDVVILSGDLGRHGMAIMAQREGLAFESPIVSDCAPLVEPILNLLEAGIEIHCLRDLTRGGLASAAIEIAEAAHVQIDLDEANIPVQEAVQGACEILGLDPLYVANEGRFIAIVPPEFAETALTLLRQRDPENMACVIGAVSESAIAPSIGQVTLKTAIGIRRLVTRLSGEQLPRIC